MSLEQAGGPSNMGPQTAAPTSTQDDDKAMFEDVFNGIHPTLSKRFKAQLIKLGQKFYDLIPKHDNALGYSMSEEDFISLQPSLWGSQGWSREMEAEFQAQWIRSPDYPILCQALQDLQSNNNKKSPRWYPGEKHSPMWKTASLLLNCWAMSIITLEHHLAYEPEPTSNGSMIWSAPFCQALTAIMVNDRSGQHVPTIRMYLQYAVICKTNDTSLWPLENTEDSMFLDLMIALIQEDKTPRRPIPDIHKEAVRRLYGPTSQRKRPESSRVFEEIEKLLYSEDTAPVQQSGRVCYKVGTSDLRHVIQAFDETRLGYYKPVIDSDTICSWFLSSRHQSKMPPNEKSLINAIKTSVEHEMRLQILCASPQALAIQADKPGGTPPVPTESGVKGKEDQNHHDDNDTANQQESGGRSALGGGGQESQRAEIPVVPRPPRRRLILAPMNPELERRILAALPPSAPFNVKVNPFLPPRPK